LYLIKEVIECHNENILQQKRKTPHARDFLARGVPADKRRSGFCEKYEVFLVTSLLCKLAGSVLSHSIAYGNASRPYNP